MAVSLESNSWLLFRALSSTCFNHFDLYRSLCTSMECDFLFILSIRAPANQLDLHLFTSIVVGDGCRRRLLSISEPFRKPAQSIHQFEHSFFLSQSLLLSLWAYIKVAIKKERKTQKKSFHHSSISSFNTELSWWWWWWCSSSSASQLVVVGEVYIHTIKRATCIYNRREDEIDAQEFDLV